MPWRPVNPKADGFLSLLGIKNLGRNPEFLMESVQPTIDMQRWYMEANCIERMGYADVPNPDPSLVGYLPATDPLVGTSIIVPEGQLWFMLDASARFLWAAGTENTFTSGARVIAQRDYLAVPQRVLRIEPPYVETDGATSSPPGPALTEGFIVPLQGRFIPAGYEIGVAAQLAHAFDGTPALLPFDIEFMLRYVVLTV